MNKKYTANRFDLEIMFNNGGMLCVDGYETIQPNAYGILFDLTCNDTFFQLTIEDRTIVINSDNIASLTAIPSKEGLK